MSDEVVAIDVNAELMDAAVKMKLYNIGMLVVSEEGRAVGVITDRDIVIRAVAESADPTLFAVRRAMTTEVVACGATETVEVAVARMKEHQIRRIVVVDAGGAPVGVLGLSDVARKAGDPALSESLLERVTEPSDREALRPHTEG